MERTGGSGFAIAVNVSAFMAGHAVAAALGGAVLAVAALLWIPIAGALLGVVALGLVWYLAAGNNPATPSDSAELGGVDGDVERSR